MAHYPTFQLDLREWESPEFVILYTVQPRKQSRSPGFVTPFGFRKLAQGFPLEIRSNKSCHVSDSLKRQFPRWTIVSHPDLVYHLEFRFAMLAQWTAYYPQQNWSRYRAIHRSFLVTRQPKHSRWCEVNNSPSWISIQCWSRRLHQGSLQIGQP